MFGNGTTLFHKFGSTFAAGGVGSSTRAVGIKNNGSARITIAVSYTENLSESVSLEFFFCNEKVLAKTRACFHIDKKC